MSNEMNVQFYDIEDISPYDPSYPIVHLENGLKQGLNKAQNIINTVVDVIQKESPILTEIHQAMKKGCRYVVDMSENTSRMCRCCWTRSVTESDEMGYGEKERNIFIQRGYDCRRIRF